MFKKILGFIGALLISGSAWAVTVSSTTPNVAILDSIFVQPNETLTYSLTGTATGTALIQVSRDGVNYEPTGVQAVGTGAVSETGTLAPGDKAAYYRWYISTITAGSFVTSLYDNDDFTAEIRNNKGQPNVQIYDDSFRFLQRMVLSPAGTVALSSTTQLDMQTFKDSFVVVTSTGGAITLSATPTIGTTGAVDGTVFIIQSATATVTLSDDDSVAGTKLELGDTSRALGVGDIIGLIYRNGSWWELFFSNL